MEDNFGDYPGRSDLTVAELSDRLAIFNMFSAYAHYAKTGDFESWSALFHPTAVFTVSPPDSPGRPMKLDELLAKERPFFATYRSLHVNPSLGETKTYRFTLPLIRLQTSSTIEALTYMSSLRYTLDGGVPHLQFAATYEGKFQKEGVNWKILEWTITAAQRPDPNSPWFPKTR